MLDSQAWLRERAAASPLAVVLLVGFVADVDGADNEEGIAGVLAALMGGRGVSPNVVDEEEDNDTAEETLSGSAMADARLTQKGRAVRSEGGSIRREKRPDASRFQLILRERKGATRLNFPPPTRTVSRAAEDQS